MKIKKVCGILLFLLLFFLVSCDELINDKNKINRPQDQLELRLNNGHIEWRLNDSDDWKIVIDSDDFKGEDGREIELDVNADSILWHYKGDSDWITLMPIDKLVGQSGKSAYDIAVSLGFVGTAEEWLSSLKGTNGREIELNVTADTIDWRYKGDTTWTTLLPLSTVAGQNGKSAYEIAVSLGFTGSAEEWVDSLKGNDGLSAYEIYLKHHPEYNKSEEEWIYELVNGDLSTKESFTITFITGFNDIVVPSQIVTKGSGIVEPDIESIIGYDFIGWYCDDTKWFFEGFIPTKDLTLVAKWEKTKYKVTLELDGGTIDGEETIYFTNGQEIELPTPTKDNYTFMGWYIGNEEFDYSTYPYYENIELQAKWYDTTNTIDAIILTDSQTGMTYRRHESANLPDGTVLNFGDVLPTWKEIGNKFNVTFNDEGNYIASTNNYSIELWKSNNYYGVNGRNVDLIMINQQVSELANNDKLIALSDYLDLMPNYKQFLEENPSIAAQLKQADGKIYSTPMFDGYNYIEKTLMLNADFVTKLLDSDTTSFDTDTIIDSYYTEFYPNMSGEILTVVNSTQSGTIDITIGETKASSAITAQESLGVLNGYNTATALRNYIDEAYRYNDELKTLYPKRSDVFLSASACYNVDDLVALFRAVKTNPKFLINKNTINVFFTRNGLAEREKDLASISAFFGARGLDSEYDELYFDNDGNLHDARIEETTYKAFQKIQQMYQEGLIVEDFDKGYGGVESSEWRENLLEEGSAFATYDYFNSTAYYCRGDSLTPNLIATLPPVVNWQVTNAPDGTKLNNFFHFSESNRSAKIRGFAIPYNYDADLKTLLGILDFMYTDEGSDLQNYGPNTIYYRSAVTTYDEDTGKRILDDSIMTAVDYSFVKISDYVLNEMNNYNLQWKEYYNKFVGSCFGIGHIRSFGLEYQTMTVPMQNGLNNINLAIKYKAMYLANNETENMGTFFGSVPLTFVLTKDEQSNIDNYCQNIINLWSETGNSCGYVELLKNADMISDEAIAKILTEDNIYNINTYYLPAYERAYQWSISS